MRHYRFSLAFILWSGIIFTACNTIYQARSLQTHSYRISDSIGRNPAIQSMLEPYQAEVNRKMNDVVGYATSAMDKKQPESTLGNFMADAMLIMAREKYQVPVDAAVMNYGGIRLTQLPAGDVPRGKIFELMPFDNLLILQKIKGDVLQQFLNLTASKGGWPLAGITMQIRDRKAVNVMVGGKPLDPAVTYTLANSDFVANGGDNADMLRAVPQIINGYLVRDAYFDYIGMLKASGKDISAQIENRVTNAQ
jgi:2',3'-cyclic-nucleotide 2'-phosphodiesterase (5'-nucleotidase family)